MSAEKLFTQGKYPEVLAKFFDTERRSARLVELTFILGSLVFSGRGADALLLMAQHSAEFSPEQMSEARFFLVIHHVRSGDIALAQNVIREAHAAVESTSRARFFMHQSDAFFNYYLGKKNDAKEAVKKSLDAAIEARTLWGRVLAMDLLAHIGFQTRQIQQSLKMFDQCLEIAAKIENENLAEALSLTSLLYRAQVTVPNAATISELEVRYQQTKVEDTYSRANILLELARQTTLIGQWQRADSFLSQALTFIYQFANAKQEVLLNFRWSYLAYCPGDFEKALNFISIAKAKAKAESAKEEALTLSVNGLELKLLEKLGFSESFAKSRRESFSKLQTTSSSHINSRIRYRQGDVVEAPRRGEDSFADWLDELEISPEKFDDVANAGLFGLLRARGWIPQKSSSLVINVEKRYAIFSDSKSTEFIQFGSRKRLFEIFMSLSEGPKNRKQLFEKIWKSRYVPRLHDSVIYANLTSLRKLLHRFAIFLEFGENGYGFSSGLDIQMIGQITSQITSPTNAPKATASPSAQWGASRPLAIGRQSDVNERQAQLLSSMKSNDLIDTRTYARFFKVSTATANRDLRELAKIGRLERSGRSRDIAYQLTKPSSSRDIF